MAAAIAAALAAPRELIHGQAFNTGASDANYLVRDLAQMVAEAVPGVEVEFAEGAGADPRSYRVDFSKIAETLDDFRPTWDARRGARGARGRLPGGRDGRGDVRRRSVRSAFPTADALDEGRLDEQLRWRAPVAAIAG